jgi:PAS domain S-box-containing protein
LQLPRLPPKPSTAESHPVRNLNRAAAILAVFVILYGLAYSAYSWRQQKATAIRELGTSMHLAKTAIDRFFVHLERDMEQLAEDLPRRNGKIDLDQAATRLRRFAETHREALDVTLAGADGRVLAAADGHAPPSRSTLAGEPSFVTFLADCERGAPLSLGPPVVDPSHGTAFVPIRVSISDANRRPLYVLSANLTHEYLRSFWSDAPIANQAAIGLMCDRGFLLSRYPVPKDMPLEEIFGKPRAGALFDYLRQENFPAEGQVEGPCTLERRDVLNVFARLPSHPVTVFAAMPLADLRAAWWRRAGGTYVTLLLVALGGFFTYRDALGRQRAWDAKQRTLEEQRRASETRFAAVFNASPLAIGISRMSDGRYVDVNDAFLALFGLRREETLGNTSLELGLWTEPADRVRLVEEIRAKGGVSGFEAGFRRKSGELGSLLISARILRVGGEETFIGLLMDRTCQIEAEKALQEANHLLNRSQRIAHLGSWVWHVATGGVVWSEEQFRIFGVGPQDFTPSYGAFLAAVHPEDRPRIEDFHREALAGKRPFSGIELRIVQPGGEVRHLLAAAEVVRDDSGAPLRVVGTNLDVTERKGIEQALRESEARYRSVVEDQTEVISRFRTDGTLLFANEVFCRFFGISQEKLVGTQWQPRAHPDDVALVEERLAALSSSNPVVVIENRIFAADGKLHWMQFVNRGRFDREGRLLEIQAVGRDITDRKQAENRQRALLEENTRLGRELIRLQEKERAELARELHDELGQQLTAIRIYATAIQRRAADPADRAAADAAAIEASAAHIYAVSHRLMEGLRPQILDSAPLAEVLRTLLSEWAAKHPEVQVTLRAAGDIGPGGGEVPIHVYRIVQESLTNVLGHARASRARIFLGAREIAGRRWLRLVVRDNGQGMGPATSEAGHGLVVMRERARNLGGRFDLQSRPGQGLRIAVAVPLASEADEGESEAGPEAGRRLKAASLEDQGAPTATIARG